MRSLYVLLSATMLFLVTVAAPALALDSVNVESDEPGTIFHAEDMAKYAEQIEQMKAQVTQLQQTYASLNGSSGVGNLFQNPQLKTMLPSNWQNVYSDVQNGGYAGITGKVANITAAENAGLGDGIDTQQANIVSREASLPVYNKAMGEEAYEAAISRLNNIEGLTSRIDAESDPKQIMDLQARIEAEQAAIQNEQTKLQLMAMLQQSESSLVDARKDAVTQNVFSTSNANIPSIGN